MKSQLPQGPGSRVLLALQSLFLILDKDPCSFSIYQGFREKKKSTTSPAKHVSCFRDISWPQGKSCISLAPNNSIFLLQWNNNSNNDDKTFWELFTSILHSYQTSLMEKVWTYQHFLKLYCKSEYVWGRQMSGFSVSISTMLSFIVVGWAHNTCQTVSELRS